MNNAAGVLYRAALDALPQDTAAGDGLPPVCIVNAWPHPLLRELAHHAAIECRQHRRSLMLELEAMGLGGGAEAASPGRSMTMALVLAGKQRLQSLGWAAMAMQPLAPDGQLLFCAANDHGARGYQRLLAQAADIRSIITKSKSRCLVIRKADVRDRSLLDRWQAESGLQRQASTGLWTQPGVFGWEHPDTGSRLLAECLPGDLTGRGMDLGCGTGILALRALRHAPGIAEMHLVDEDALALDCARRNLAEAATDRPGLSIHAHWRDATRESLPHDLDFVLLNPPFHAGKRRDIGLGRAMVRAACESLRPGGRLFLVANRKLPYEAELNASLASWRTLIERQGFKVIEGRR